MAADNAIKVRENRLRRMAERRGLAIEKSRQRDPGGREYGTYRVVDPYSDNKVVAAEFNREYGLSLNRVEEVLTNYKPEE